MTVKKHKKRYFLGFLIGFIVCLTVFSIAGLFVYKLAPTGVKSKVSYYLKKAAQNLLHVSKRPVKSPDKPQSGPIMFEVHADHVIREINPLIYGSNLTAKTEFEMDVAQFAKDIGITNMRFPGGSSDGYRWKLAKFDFNDRYDEAPLANIENVIKFCRIMDVELTIQVTIESGGPEEAAEWVHYMNKGRGNFRVNYWEIGNEAYGDWDRAHMSGKDYAKLVREYSVLMKKVDPTIKIGANLGGERFQAFDEAVIKGAADYIDFISYHWYPNHINKKKMYKGRAHPLPKEVMANGLAVGKILDRYKNMILKYAPHRQGKIEFTITEWDGSWDAVPTDLQFEYRGIMWSLANAIFYADALGQFALHGINVANHYDFQEVMFGLIRGWDKQAGWGGSRWDGKTIRPKALALKLFARHFRDVLVKSEVKGTPLYYKEADWRADSYTGQVPYVTGYASRSLKENVIVIALINKHAEKDFDVNISINGVIVEDKGDVWILNGPDLTSQNDGSPGTVDIKKYELSDIKNKFNYNVEPHSVNMLKIPIRLGTE